MKTTKQMQTTNRISPEELHYIARYIFSKQELGEQDIHEYLPRTMGKLFDCIEQLPVDVDDLLLWKEAMYIVDHVRGWVDAKRYAKNDMNRDQVYALFSRLACQVLSEELSYQRFKAEALYKVNIEAADDQEFNNWRNKFFFESIGETPQPIY